MMDRPHSQRRTWAAHLPVLVGAVVAVLALRWTHVELLVPAPVFGAAIGAAVVAGRTAFRIWSTVEHGWRLHARILSHVLPIAVLTYMTGWGSVLVGVQLVAVASNAKHGSFSTLRRTLAWACGTTLVMELGVATGVVYSALGPTTSHAIAVVGCGAAIFIGSEFAHADRARRRAERDQRALAADVVQHEERQRWLQDEITWHTHHDDITGLPNRATFLGMLRERLAAGGQLCVLQVGLEGLSTLTDVHGSGVSHLVRHETAKRISATCRPRNAVAASIAPEVFGVLVAVPSGPPDVTEAHRLASGFTAAVRLPISTGTGTVHVTAGVGITHAGPTTTAELALFEAAVAFQAASLRGVERIEVYEPVQHSDVADRLTLAADLRGAVVNQDFDLDFQPIVDLRTGRTVSAEALVRWDHPTRGRLGPDRFIPEAERSGHITQIGRYMLEEAAWQARAWERDLGAQAPSVAVNLSARQLDGHLLAVLEEVLDDTMLAPERLTLELTETALAPGGEQLLRHRLEQLKELGVTLALDDFGTGYSSLEHLEQLPLDVLKIDRVFVEHAMDGTRSVAGAMVSLARAMGLTTVIEGIETPTQRDRFVELGCDRAQGYLFSQPLPVALMNRDLRAEHALAV